MTYTTGSDCVIRDADGNEVARCMSGSYEESEANAKLIVEALNKLAEGKA